MLNQDIVRPLSIEHSMPPEAATEVAHRLARTGIMLGSRAILKRVRMSATDVQYSQGTGEEISGPIAELVMLRAGRAPRWDQLEGAGVELARQMWLRTPAAFCLAQRQWNELPVCSLHRELQTLPAAGAIGHRVGFLAGLQLSLRVIGPHCG